MTHRREHALQILVRDNNIDQALRVLKKKMQREGVFREMKLRRFYEKPSEKTARQRAEAIRRGRKYARKQAQREGLTPLPRKKKLPGAKAGGPGRPKRPDQCLVRAPLPDANLASKPTAVLSPRSRLSGSQEAIRAA
jgi:small subunit ribosomal protein S21